jgi:hypothetical protein
MLLHCHRLLLLLHVLLELLLHCRAIFCCRLARCSAALGQPG